MNLVVYALVEQRYFIKKESRKLSIGTFYIEYTLFHLKNIDSEFFIDRI